MIKEFLENIENINFDMLNNSVEYETSLVKPPHSLGALEDFAIKMSAIKNELKPQTIKKRILVFAGDNGVVEEGVSCSPKRITYEQCINLTKALTGCSSMSKANGFDLEVYDVGVDFDFNKYYEENKFDENDDRFRKLPFDSKRVIDKKIRRGTNNLLYEDAMTIQECENAILIGINSVEKAKNDGIDIIGIGEMGIGNTTTSSALLAYFSSESVDKLTGKGGGLLDEALKHKIAVIEKAIERTQNNIKTKSNNDYDMLLELLSSLGGFDIAAMCGAFIGAAYYKMPVVIDGFISVVAAMMASCFNSKCVEYMYASHISAEIGYNEAIKIINQNFENVNIFDKNEKEKFSKNSPIRIINLHPMFDLGMRLGEGSGCVLAFQIIDTALAMHRTMATFEEAKINDEYLEEIRKI